MSKDAIQTRKPALVDPLGDLAYDLDVTRQAIYAAADRGHIGGTIRTGKHRKILKEARQYHATHGYGAGIPPWNSPTVGSESEPATASAKAWSCNPR
jgi:hypothetical protein